MATQDPKFWIVLFREIWHKSCVFNEYGLSSDERIGRLRDEVERLREELTRRERDANKLQQENARQKRQIDGLRRQDERQKREIEDLKRQSGRGAPGGETTSRPLRQGPTPRARPAPGPSGGCALRPACASPAPGTC